MSLANEKQLEQMGMTFGCENRDDGLIHELDARLRLLWLCNRHVTRHDGNSSLQNRRRQLKREARERLERIKMHVAREV